MSELAPPIRCSSCDRLAILLAVLIFSGLSLWSAITSVGFLEADACTHYMYARFALGEHHFLINVWGRPVCTGIYAIPAALGGRIGVRVMSLLLALACGWIAYAIAKRQGYRRPALALVFTLAQPLVFLHSFSELTELPFAVLLGLGFLAYQRRWFALMALAIGLTPASRPEGFGFLILAAISFLAHRRWYWIALLLLPLALWNYLGWDLYGRQVPWWKWLISEWPYAGQSLYKPGVFFHFVGSLPAIVSPFLFPAVLLGIWLALKKANRLIDILIAAIPLLILVGHSLLFWLGKMASNGELRYMLIVAPFWGILAARGWTWIFDQFNFKHEMRWAALASLTPILVNFIYPVIPLDFKLDWQQAQRVAQWYQSSDVVKEYPMLLASHPGIYYFLDQSWTDTKSSREWRKETIDRMPPGTLLIWDPVYGVFNADRNRSVPKDEIERAGWVPLQNGPQDSDGFQIYHSKLPISAFAR